ncbi:UNVERIFIED_CONTAM: hypothetical protein Scaly_0535600 [Sesamum calycinum]|uniref:Uncharacterized protein n=2 Tax=Sesamum TaxID=4181 RepID=A0AAW2RQT4_9LAMI
MAVSSVYITAPAAAAVGLYLFARNLPRNLAGGGGEGMRRPNSRAAEVKKADVKVGAEPKLAPEFDGLCCFETIVGR